MKPPLAATLLLCCALAFSAVTPVFAADRTVDLYGSLGYSSVDLESWGRIGLDDWNQMSYGGHAQVFPLRTGALRLGAEAGYDYLFWYYSHVWGTREAAPTHVAAVAQMDLAPRVFIEAAAGMFFFSEFSDPGVMGGLGIRIPWTKKISVPVKLRGGVILDQDTNVIPITISAGVSIRY